MLSVICHRVYSIANWNVIIELHHRLLESFLSELQQHHQLHKEQRGKFFDIIGSCLNKLVECYRGVVWSEKIYLILQGLFKFLVVDLFASPHAPNPNTIMKMHVIVVEQLPKWIKSKFLGKTRAVGFSISIFSSSKIVDFNSLMSHANMISFSHQKSSDCWFSG